MKIGTEAITDPYGGLYTHTKRMKKYSSHSIEEIPSKLTRLFLNRSRWLKNTYKEKLKCVKGYDILHSRSDPWFINLCRNSRSNKCKWVHTFHTLFFEEHYTGGLKPWMKDINKALLEVACQADVRIAVSQWGHDYLLKNYSIDTVVIENGADFEVCKRADAKRFIEEYGLEGFVLFVGSFREVKDPCLFIKLAARMPEVKFVFVGDGADEATLTSKYQVSIPSNLILMGRLPHDVVLDAMAACRVFMMTSKSEGLPNSLLEAMAVGKPVVVPNHTGCKEVVHSNEYGFLFDTHLFDELVEQTRKALVSEDIGEKGRQRIREKYDWRISAKKLDDLYSSCR